MLKEIKVSKFMCISVDAMNSNEPRDATFAAAVTAKEINL